MSMVANGVQPGHEPAVEPDPRIARAVRTALECVAVKLEAKAANPTYRAAWKIAAKIIRDSKPD